MDEITVEIRAAWNPSIALPEGKKMILERIQDTVDKNETLQNNPPEITFPALHFDGVVLDEKRSVGGNAAKSTY